jgi:pyrroloquinoline quinone biosynthesis protein B
MRDFLIKNSPWNQLIEKENILPIILSPNERLPLTSRISVVPFQVPHRDEYSDTLGFIISGSKKNLLYLPDIQNWEAWERSIIEEVQKAEIALLDGTFYSPEELPGRDLPSIGHPFIKKSIEMLNEVPQKGKTAIYFTHLNHSNLILDPEGEARKNVIESGFAIAADGLEIPL